MTNKIKGIKKIYSELKNTYPHAFGALRTEIYYNPQQNSVEYNTTLNKERYFLPDTDNRKFLFWVDCYMSMKELEIEITQAIKYKKDYIW